MSLFDALLRDSLLNTVVQSDVYIAIRTDGAPGAGTEEDPYNGGKPLLTSGTDPDKLGRVQENATTSSWPQSGQRTRAKPFARIPQSR